MTRPIFVLVPSMVCPRAVISVDADRVVEEMFHEKAKFHCVSDADSCYTMVGRLGLLLE